MGNRPGYGYGMQNSNMYGFSSPYSQYGLNQYSSQRSYLPYSQYGLNRPSYGGIQNIPSQFPINYQNYQQPISRNMWNIQPSLYSHPTLQTQSAYSSPLSPLPMSGSAQIQGFGMPLEQPYLNTQQTYTSGIIPQQISNMPYYNAGMQL